MSLHCTQLVMEHKKKQKRVWRDLDFGVEKAAFLHLTSDTGSGTLLSFSAKQTFAEFWLVEEDNF